MSRIGRRPILLPPGVEVKTEGNQVWVKGPKGSLSRQLPTDMKVVVDGGKLLVERPSDSGVHRAQHGLVRSLLANMVQGVSQGFERALEIGGLGYRAQKTGEKLTLSLGHSHPLEFTPPPGINLQVEGTTRIRVMGIDKELVGLVTSQIRELRTPDSYKGKGIRYVEERIRLKPGKAGKAVKK